MTTHPFVRLVFVYLQTPSLDLIRLLRDPKMYTDGFRSKARSAKSTTPVGTPKLPMWCEDDQSKCVHGPKQMIWNQLERTNIEVERGDLSGSQKSQAWVQFQVVQGRYAPVLWVFHTYRFWYCRFPGRYFRHRQKDGTQA